MVACRQSSPRESSMIDCQSSGVMVSSIWWITVSSKTAIAGCGRPGATAGVLVDRLPAAGLMGRLVWVIPGVVKAPHRGGGPPGGAAPPPPTPRGGPRRGPGDGGPQGPPPPASTATRQQQAQHRAPP